MGVENDTIITNEYIKSSHSGSNYKAYKGRLNYPLNSWAAYGRFETTYLEISIGRQLSVITAVATQGNGLKKEWVKTYKLAFSRWGEEWMPYTEDGKVKVSGYIYNFRIMNFEE